MNLRRHLNDYEVDHIARLLGIVEIFNLSREREDAWCRTYVKMGTFQ